MVVLECINSESGEGHEIFGNIENENGRRIKIKKVTIAVPDYVFTFYEKVGKQAGGISVEKVMSDALFKLAGELSLNAIDKQKRMAD